MLIASYKKFCSYKTLLISLAFIGIISTQSFAQQVNRFEIDLKRDNLSAKSPEMLLRSREFIRLDPTYYVGYLCEAEYRYERSSDINAYKQVLPLLKKALQLFETDYSDLLKNAYRSPSFIENSRSRLIDYVILTDKLTSCYNALERPDSVVLVLEHYKKWNFIHDILGADNHLAWTYHRNRFFTSNKFSFLQNSIAANEQVALNYLKNSLKLIDKNADNYPQAINYQMVLRSKMSVYHYLTIVYSYMRKPDSARMYYELMRPYNIFPYNNYAIFCYVNGDFEEAIDNFEQSEYREYEDHRLQESFYYLSILNTMRAKPHLSVEKLTNQINENGVRPGWGWYNIGLGRAQTYNGLIDEAYKNLKKAETFKEIHIGTTLTDSHYVFSTQLLLLYNMEQKMAYLKFEDPYYWLKPYKIKQLAEYKFKLYTARVALFNQISTNVEREDLYYRLFASEGTVSFDEIYCLIKDYGQNYFIKSFSNQNKNDERINIRKYFSLLQARLLIEKGNESEALTILTTLQAEIKRTDMNYEVLFEARLLEALTKVYLEEGERDKAQSSINRLYRLYPQLIPFSGLCMNFELNVTHEGESFAEKVIDQIKKYDIEIKSSSKGLPKINLDFSSSNVPEDEWKLAGSKPENRQRYHVTVSVQNSKGKYLIPPQDITAKKSSDLADQIIKRIFKIGITKETNDENQY